MLKKSVQILLLGALILGFTSQTAYAQVDPFEKQDELAEKLMADSNFPLSANELDSFMKDIDRNAGSMISGSDVPVDWQAYIGTGPAYQQYKGSIFMPKALGENVYLGTLSTAKKIEKHKGFVKAVLAHEYGHVLLHKNLMKESPSFASIHETLKEMNGRNLEGRHATVPSNIYMNAQLVMSYHEFFGDVVAWITTGDQKKLPDAMKYAMGVSTSDIAHRYFPEAATAKTKKMVEKQIQSAQEHSIFDPYVVFVNQRPLIVQFLKKNPGQESKVIELVYFAIRDEANKFLPMPSNKISLRAVIMSFEASLKKQLQL